MNAFLKWLVSPLSEWHIISLQHKLFVGASGAAMFYFLWKHQKWALWKSAMAAFGVAYGTSMLLNAMRRFTTPALAAAPTPASYPSVQTTVQPDMAATVEPIGFPEPAPSPVVDMDDADGAGEGIFD